MGGFFVVLSGESRQAIVVDEDTKGITGCHRDVNTKIEFESIDEKGLKRTANSKTRSMHHTRRLTRLT